MKNSKKGISLIVLVITILVIIVLAGAVILTVSQNNPLDNANKANILSDRVNIQNAATLFYSQNADIDNISVEGAIYLPLVNPPSGDAQTVTLAAFTEKDAVDSKVYKTAFDITEEGSKLIETKLPVKDGLTWKIDASGKVFMEFANGKVPKWAKDDANKITYDYILETPAVPTP